LEELRPDAVVGLEEFQQMAAPGVHQVG